MRDLLIIAIVGMGSLVALWRPVFGVLLFVCLGFLNPQSMTWGIGREFPLSQLVAVTTMVGYVVWPERKKFPPQRELFLLLALWGMFGISTFFAIYPDVSLAQLVLISKILLMVFLVMSLINTEERIRWLLRVTALSLGFHALKGGLFFVLSGGNFIFWGPQGSFLEANNSIGLALAMNIPLLAYLWKVETAPRLRLVIAAMLAFSYPAVLATYSRGAWIGLAVVSLLLLLRSKRRVMLVPAVAILALAAIPFVHRLAPERMVYRYGTLVNYEEDDSAVSRFWNWEFCKRVGMAHPLTGAGFDYYNLELYPKYYPEFVERWGPDKMWSCHSSWLSVFGEHGAPGFLLWIALLSSCFLSLRKLRALGRQFQDVSWMGEFSHMLQISLIAYMVVGTFIDAAYFDLLYYLIAVIIILKERAGQIVAERSRTDKGTPSVSRWQPANAWGIPPSRAQGSPSPIMPKQLLRS